jgi:hypothetical protein
VLTFSSSSLHFDRILFFFVVVDVALLPCRYTDVQDTVSIIAVVITRYPDRLYHFLRKAFTLAALQGHDVTQRAAQAEVLAVVAPTLIEYFTKLVKGERAVQGLPPSSAPAVAAGAAGGAASSVASANASASASNAARAADELEPQAQERIEPPRVSAAASAAAAASMVSVRSGDARGGGGGTAAVAGGAGSPGASGSAIASATSSGGADGEEEGAMARWAKMAGTVAQQNKDVSVSSATHPPVSVNVRNKQGLKCGCGCGCGCGCE